MEGLLYLIFLFAIVFLIYKYYSIKLKLEKIAEGEKEMRRLISKEYQIKFEEWIKKKEKEIKNKAIDNSKKVILGKIYEQFAPYTELRKYYINPKDARFLGEPIDYVVFRGLSEGKLKEILFVEIKTGDSKLTKNEKEIKDIIEKKKVDFLEVRL